MRVEAHYRKLLTLSTRSTTPMETPKWMWIVKHHRHGCSGHASDSSVSSELPTDQFNWIECCGSKPIKHTRFLKDFQCFRQSYGKKSQELPWAHLTLQPEVRVSGKYVWYPPASFDVDGNHMELNVQYCNF